MNYSGYRKPFTFVMLNKVRNKMKGDRVALS